MSRAVRSTPKVSLTSVTVTAMVCVAVRPTISVTPTSISYTLSVSSSVGASKSGAFTKLSTPVVGLMVNLAWSAPPVKV